MIYDKVQLEAVLPERQRQARNLKFFEAAILHIVVQKAKKGTDQTAGPRSAVGNVSGYRCVSDCRSRGREFDPGPVPYFRGD